LTVEAFNVPRGVILINWALCLLGLSSIRVLSRLYNDHARWQESSGARKRVLLVGAGDTGAAIAKQILSRPDTNMQPVGFLDDNAQIHGLRVHTLPVLGAISEIAEISKTVAASEAFICMPSASGAQIRAAVQQVVGAGLHARILPGLEQLVAGQVSLELLRDVEITDLLGREPVRIDQTAVSHLFRGKSVMVTGAGGSIGSELCRQILGLQPARLILVDRAEPLLFATEQELLKRQATQKLSGCSLHTCPGDIADDARMSEIFRCYAPEIVCHAAAHKHVPMMEGNPGEATKNNVFGTRCLAESATRHGVRVFVMVSTDKAINPTSIMGATKRVAEIFVQALARRCSTTFVTVRFGNVLGSSGSVVPIFREQIASGGPVTVTHPDMKRYFMLIPEAVQLVLQAAAFGHGGQIFVLDMGEPVRIVDMARELIRLSGLRPDVDIPIKFTGLRPGEKLFEELRLDGESVEKTPHERIRVVKAVETKWEDLLLLLNRLHAATISGEAATIREAIRDIVPEYAPPQPPVAQSAPSPAGETAK
jgi:FlaA1/EpsC-like NDP-sugar epimerase